VRRRRWRTAVILNSAVNPILETLFSSAGSDLDARSSASLRFWIYQPRHRPRSDRGRTSAKTQWLGAQHALAVIASARDDVSPSLWSSSWQG